MRSPRRLLARLRRPRLARSAGEPAPTSVPAPVADGTYAEAPDQLGYAPKSDGLPDPGEIVWGWVPFEEDASRGKDRPVLLIGRRTSAGRLQWLALMLTSKDHDRDAADEARFGRHWMDVGTGGWDREGRPSEVRLDRLIVLEEDAIRREGAALDRLTFDAVVSAAGRFHSVS